MRPKAYQVCVCVREIEGERERDKVCVCESKDASQDAGAAHEEACETRNLDPDSSILIGRRLIGPELHLISVWECADHDEAEMAPTLHETEDAYVALSLKWRVVLPILP